MFLSLGSAFHWFCATRTFANSLETVVMVSAMSLWPWAVDTSSEKRKFDVIYAPGSHLRYALSLAALACVLRPTNALIWLILGTSLLFRARTGEERSRLILETLWIGFHPPSPTTSTTIS